MSANLDFFVGCGMPRTLLRYRAFTRQTFARSLAPFNYKDRKGDEKLWSIKEQISDLKVCFADGDLDAFDLAVFSAKQTDAPAHLAALYALKQLMRVNENLRIEYVGLFPGMRLFPEDGVRLFADVTVYYNVYKESTAWRQELLRDFLTFNPNPKIVVTSGCTPFEFAAYVARRPAQLAVHLNG